MIYGKQICGSHHSQLLGLWERELMLKFNFKKSKYFKIKLFSNLFFIT